MERCPICRARYKNNPCYRCGSPLNLLLNVERQAEQQLHLGVKALAAGDEDTARRYFQQAASLHRTPLTLALLEFVSLAPQDPYMSG